MLIPDLKFSVPVYTFLPALSTTSIVAFMAWGVVNSTAKPAAEAAGGLHVCLTFLPESYRVELQNVGRTARQGKKGSAQLVLHATQPYDQLRQARDDQETQATTRAKKGVAGLLVEDQLFNRFCALENELLPRNS